MGLFFFSAGVGALAAYCSDRLSAVAGVELLTPSDAHAGLVHVRLRELDFEACVGALAERGVTVRAVPDTQSLRVSCAFFNIRADIDRLVDALKALSPSRASR